MLVGRSLTHASGQSLVDVAWLVDVDGLGIRGGVLVAAVMGIVRGVACNTASTGDLIQAEHAAEHGAAPRLGNAFKKSKKLRDHCKCVG